MAQWLRICLSMQEMQKTRIGSQGWEDRLKEEIQPTPVFLPGKSHKQRGLQATVHGVAEFDTTG